MNELVAWLRRLSDVEVDEVTRSIVSRNRIFRVSSPSVLDFDDSVIRVQDTGVTLPSIGSLPTRVSVLHFLDPAQDDYVRDQAVATQIGALLTLSSNRKVRVASAEVAIKMEGSDLTTFLPSGVDDREIGGPIPTDVKDEFERLLGDLASLSADDVDAIGRAIELHYAAAHLHETDLNTAHMLTVAGIETLATRYESSLPTWEAFDDAARFDEEFDRASISAVQRVALRSAILEGKHVKLRQRFASYAVHALPVEFWAEPIKDFTADLRMNPDGSTEFAGVAESTPIPMTNVVPEDRQVLRRRLLASYDARSSYVHSGRRSQDPKTTLSALTGAASNRGVPLVFAGLRRILRQLILSELGSRSSSYELPEVRLRHQ